MTTLDQAGVPPAEDRMRVGTLRYTMGGLVWVFVWLLWGDFVFTLMEAVAPAIVPLRLKDLGIGDWPLAIVTAALPQLINTGLNPIISTASDRFRSRMGRRVPFMLFSAPFISGALVLLAFSPEIAAWLQHIGPLSAWTAGVVGVVTLSVLWIFFTVLNMFATTVYYYFFNDVVPGPYMARFFGLFRMIGSMGGFIWSTFLYATALTHWRSIFLTAAAIFFAGFMMMCLGIKEGRYPPPAPLGQGFWSKMRTYAKECCCHRLYILMFAHNVCWSVSGACGIYTVFLNRDSLGVPLTRLGPIAGVVSLVQFFLSYPAGMLSDKFHPMRVMLWIKIGLVAIVPLNFIWLFGNFRPQTAFYILIGLAIVELPLGLLYDMTRQPMQMLVWPKSRYGQFCSFNAIVQAASGFVVSFFMVGPFMDLMRWFFPDKVWGKDYCYRLIPAWRMPFLCAALLLLFMMYRQWLRLGGLKDYKVPGFDEDPAVEVTGFPVEVAEVQPVPADAVTPAEALVEIAPSEGAPTTAGLAAPTPVDGEPRES